MKVSFEGIGEELISFAAADSAVKGVFVKMSGNGTVAACASGDRFVGFCTKSENGFADVMTHGYIQCGYTGSTAPALGYNLLAADTLGKLVPSQSGRECLVLEVDTTAKTVGLIM